IVRAPSDKPRVNAGVPVLLIRNLDIPRLHNGTRSQITHKGGNVMKATVTTDIGRRESILIPRLPIMPQDLSSQFRRQQIPLKCHLPGSGPDAESGRCTFGKTIFLAWATIHGVFTCVQPTQPLHPCK
ncbi:hypothetical protein AVEN_43866-1, partial [Araneus ventricosus]